ncbi:MAG TPA: alpha/beta fold hydrolase [Gemmatimonas sp.]|nr:alpha/beta fold hydrolase [Gemmatimonas sp.]
MRAQQDALPRRSLFGAQLVPVPDTVRTRLNLAAGEGLALLSVTPGSTAAAAGLRVLDVLLAVDDTRVTSPQAGVTALRSIPVGRPVRFRFARAGRVDSVSTTMRERPRQQGENFRTHYDHVTVDGKRFRVMVTQPMRAGQPVAGAHPTLFVIGGIGPYSLDGPFESISYGDMLGAAVERGWATVRVDKAGQGDSEGGPTPEADFESELAMYRATMRALPRYSFVDTGRVFLFGHSMGGVFGPLLTVERSAGTPSLKGIAVYGTIAKSWPEYWVEAVRRQATLGALPLVTVDRIVREQAWLSHYLVMEGIEPADIRARHPELATALAAHVPDGRTISGLAFPFWRQLARRQLADAWSAYDGAVLSMHGESDFVGARGDHELIADIVNQAKPGRATFRSIPNSDHTFQQHATMPASLRAQGPAAINPAARLALFEWLDRLVASHKNRTGGADR